MFARDLTSNPPPAEALWRDIECKLSEIPNSVFERSPPGREFTLGDRALCLVRRPRPPPPAPPAPRLSLSPPPPCLLALTLQAFRLAPQGWTALQYGTLGVVCGGVAEAVTELLPAPPTASPLPGVIPVALLWARYMAFSCAIRYQIVGGIENLAERSPVGKSAVGLVAVSLAVVRQRLAARPSPARAAEVKG